MQTQEIQLPTESEVRRRVGDGVFRRGDEYCRRGAVLSLSRRGGALLAEVAGSEAAPYRVTVTVGRRGEVRAACTCPFMEEGDGWCKHVVAALLRAEREPEAVSEEPALETLLAPLTAEQLRAFVAQWAGEDPDGYDRVRAYAARCREPGGGRESVDAVRRATRRRVRRILHSLDHLDPPETRRHAGELASAVEEVVGEALDCARGGECAASLAMLEALTAEYVAGWTRLDDSDGELGAVFWTLASAWAESVLTAPLTPEGRRVLADRLQEWSAEARRHGVDSFDLAVAAAEEGWEAPRVARALAGEPVAPREAADGGEDPRADEDAGDDEHGWSWRDLAEIRLEVLERSGRREDALRLALAEGLHGRAADLLLAGGRVDEALALALEHPASHAETLALARRLWAEGEAERALQLGERALADPGAKDAAPLAAWVRDRAREAGRPALELRAAEHAFAAAPDLAAWQALRRAAGREWPALRERMLEQLRAGPRRPWPGVVDVLLHEERFADALDAVEESRDYELVGRVADACAERLPARVIPLCRGHAEAIMDAGQSGAYGAAARWLRRARRAYAAAGREREWSEYLARLLARHQKKHRLRPILESLARPT
ncbi:MAG TPA: SWIM zinc finger family protein [Longimicrobium sp.]